MSGPYLYRISVQDTDISETYSYDDKVGVEEVREDWLNDVSEKDLFGEKLAENFAGKIEINPLWTKTHSERQEEDSPIPMPPVPEEEPEEAEERESQ